MARVLLIKEPSFVEIQEPAPGEGYQITIESSMFLFDADTKEFYQFMDGPSNQEIVKRTEEMKAMKDPIEQATAFASFKAEVKERSKRVLYKIFVDGKDLADKIKEMIASYDVSKEFYVGKDFVEEPELPTDAVITDNEVIPEATTVEQDIINQEEAEKASQ